MLFLQGDLNSRTLLEGRGKDLLLEVEPGPFSDSKISNGVHWKWWKKKKTLIRFNWKVIQPGKKSVGPERSSSSACHSASLGAKKEQGCFDVFVLLDSRWSRLAKWKMVRGHVSLKWYDGVSVCFTCSWFLLAFSKPWEGCNSVSPLQRWLALMQLEEHLACLSPTSFLLALQMFASGHHSWFLPLLQNLGSVWSKHWQVQANFTVTDYQATSQVSNSFSCD